MNNNTKLRYYLTGALALLVLAYTFWQIAPLVGFSFPALAKADPQEVMLDSVPVADTVTKPVHLRFGLPTDSFQIEEGRIGYGETFAEILQNKVDYAKIHAIATQHREVLNVNSLQQGKRYYLFHSLADSVARVRYMVYQPTARRYYVIDLGDSLHIYRKDKPVALRQKEIAGVIQSSLYETMLQEGGSIELAMRLSDIYAWTIDFFRLQKGDYFKVRYRENYIDDTLSVGVADIQAVAFSHGGTVFYAFHFTADSLFNEYYDEQGENLRRAFLKAPLKFSRISSRYNPRRFHPVLKQVRPHLGTDYAAPRGTPIMSTADGTVIAASYTRGNGNYVKVRHNSTYTTQYLHMTRIAKGIRRGKVVKQGEVIGYVGSTGLATGPHVCYRFWKNGKQVDPYQQDLPAAEPIAEEWQEEFYAIRDSLLPLLQQMPLKEEGSDTPVEERG